MKEALNKIKEGIIDILLPKFCIGCGREGEYICKDCEIFLSEVPPLPEIISVWEYEGIIEKAIYKIKYGGCYDIINELADKAFEKIELNLPKNTVITYVPMWPKGERRRGFNQAELIARKLGRLLNLTDQPLLEKVKDNRSQVGLKPKEREENVRGVFQINYQFPRPTSPKDEAFGGQAISNFQNVLLVDDVYTTGATAKECVKVLRKVGVKNIWVFTLARKLRT